ncbi:MAG: hypothetical protein ACTTJ3_05985 [Treponema sp.]
MKKSDNKIKKRNRKYLYAITKYKSKTKEAQEKKKRIMANATKIRKIRIWFESKKSL